MYVVLGIFILMDLIVLTVWQIIDPLYRKIERFPLEIPQVADKDLKYEPQLEHCDSKYLNIWLGECALSISQLLECPERPVAGVS